MPKLTKEHLDELCRKAKENVDKMLHGPTNPDSTKMVDRFKRFMNDTAEVTKLKAQKALVLNIRGCARCGKNHKAIAFVKFKRGGQRHSHWAMCPNRQEPLVLAIMPEHVWKKENDIK